MLLSRVNSPYCCKIRKPSFDRITLVNHSVFPLIRGRWQVTVLVANGKNNFFIENSVSLCRIFVQKMIKDRVKNHAEGGSVWSGWIGFGAVVSEPLATINRSLSSLILDPAGSGPVRMAHLAPWWDQWKNINTTEAIAIKKKKLLLQHKKTTDLHPKK